MAGEARGKVRQAVFIVRGMRPLDALNQFVRIA